MATRPDRPRLGSWRRPRSVRTSAAAVCLAATIWLGAACGGGGATPGTSTDAQPPPSVTATPGTSLSAADIQQITANWIFFFDGSADPNKKIALLQNGDVFSDVIRVQAKLPLALGSSATVANVSFLAPGRAKVLYSILVDGKPALPNQVGLSVLEDGTWKVADASFCALLTLEGSKTPLCSAPSSSASPSA